MHGESEYINTMTCDSSLYSILSLSLSLSLSLAHIHTYTHTVCHRGTFLVSHAYQATSLLDIMLQERARAQIDDGAETATLTEIRDQIGTFLAAGHETTASLLSFAMLHISGRQVTLQVAGVCNPATARVLCRRSVADRAINSE